MIQKILLHILQTCIGLILIIASVYPVLWFVSISFQSDQSAYSVPTRWFFRPELTNYRKMLTNPDFTHALISSIQISATVTLVCVFLGALAGFALSRYKIKGKPALTSLITVTRLIPTFAIIIPTFYIYRQLNLLDTLLGLDIALVAFQLPLSILIMYRLMNSIPRAIDEAAYLDGAGPFRIFMQVILPISRSGLASSAAVTFILVWNEFLFVLVLAGNKILTMPLVIASFQTDKAILWGSIAASSVISLVPILLILIGLQRQIISGLSSGSVIE